MKHRTWVVEEPGGSFVDVEVPTPEPKQGEALVKIAASGVCLLDTKIRAGKAFHAKQPLPAVLGLDMAGLWSKSRHRCLHQIREDGVPT